MTRQRTSLPTRLGPQAGRRGDGTEARTARIPASGSDRMLAADRALLIHAFKTGLIAAWKRDADRGYRLIFAGRPDEYVKVPDLGRYLERLTASPVDGG